jgi:hypothetical protein
MTVGELPALLTICKFAVRAPVAVGANEIAIVQLAPVARELPQVLLSMGKSPGFAPPKFIPEIVSATLPVLVNVIV